MEDARYGTGASAPAHRLHAMTSEGEGVVGGYDSVTMCDYRWMEKKPFVFVAEKGKQTTTRLAEPLSAWDKELYGGQKATSKSVQPRPGPKHE